MGAWVNLSTRCKRRNRALVGDVVVVDLSNHTVVHIRERVRRQVTVGVFSTSAPLVVKAVRFAF